MLARTTKDTSTREVLRTVVDDIHARADKLEKIFKIEVRPQAPS